MATQVYVTPQNGLVIPSLTAIQAALALAFQNALDPNIDTSADSPLGQMIGVFSDEERQIWEILLIAYNGFNPDGAEGFLLDTLCAITGIIRNPPTPSYFSGVRQAIVQLNPGVTVQPGTIFGIPGTTTQFTVVQGVSSPASGPSPTGAVGWYAVPLCQCTAIDPATGVVGGPTICNAGALTQIVTPVTGLLAVSNAVTGGVFTGFLDTSIDTLVSGPVAANVIAVGGDAYVGTLLETDPALRLRREQALRAEGNGTVGAIASKVLQISVDGVQTIIACTVLENDQDTIDPLTGLLPHSFEVLLFDGLANPTPANVIAQTIWDAKPAGIRDLGNSFGTAIDSAGNPQTVYFTRPQTLEIKIAVSLDVTAAYGGAAGTKQDIVNQLASMATQVFETQTVFFSAFFPVILAEPGVTSIESIALGFGSPGAPFTDLAIGLRQIVYAQTSDVTVTT